MSMKTFIITFFTILFCLTSSVGWSVTLDDLEERDGIYYKKFTEVPFTGKVKGKTQGSMKNGKKDGSWIGYFDNGQLHYKGDYKNGKREGYWVWNNSVMSGWTGTYKDGKKISD